MHGYGIEGAVTDDDGSRDAKALQHSREKSSPDREAGQRAPAAMLLWAAGSYPFANSSHIIVEA